MIFSCCHCPYVIAWEGRLSEIAADYAGRAALLAINANDHIGDTLDDMRARANERPYGFPFLRDESQEVARSYGATRTPEVFALDRQHRLIYRGAPDSSYQDPGGAVPYLRTHLTRHSRDGHPLCPRRQPSAARSSGGPASRRAQAALGVSAT